MQQHYIVCGMGHLGQHVVELLRRLREHLLTGLRRRVEGGWVGRTKTDLLREEQILVLFLRGATDAEYAWVDEESPLREGEEVIAVAWRKLQPFQAAPY